MLCLTLSNPHDASDWLVPSILDNVSILKTISPQTKASIELGKKKKKKRNFTCHAHTATILHSRFCRFFASSMLNFFQGLPNFALLVTVFPPEVGSGR